MNILLSSGMLNSILDHIEKALERMGKALAGA